MPTPPLRTKRQGSQMTASKRTKRRKQHTTSSPPPLTPIQIADVKTIEEGLQLLSQTDVSHHPKPERDDRFVQALNRIIPAASADDGSSVDDAFRDAVLRVDKTLNPSERKECVKWIWTFQEDPTTLKNKTCSRLKAGKKCYRNCPVHNLSHSLANPATLIAAILTKKQRTSTHKKTGSRTRRKNTIRSKSKSPTQRNSRR